MVVQRLVADVMTAPVISVTAATPLQQAVQLLSDHHISGLPVLDDNGQLVGELSEQQLMARETGFDAGPYVMLLDSVIYLKNPLQWDKEVHQVLGNTVGELMSAKPHTCPADLGLPAAAKLLQDRRTQRLFVLDEAQALVGVLTRGDVVRALAEAGA
ncbi:MAG: CBS domain-containing protein [Synechococcus sp. MED-G71]|nr:MAG: CBS domain-containing protein [Synechococcus sp. MED-G71]RPF78276.1 MAG: CBS domain-containing protein [Synechococcus sp. TMED155]|tara:strand:- start:6909 stop:7379 length:471 start_codon:yes stop_codon:yes gene_type:complete